MRSRHEETAGIESAAARGVPRYGHAVTVERFADSAGLVSANVGTRGSTTDADRIGARRGIATSVDSASSTRRRVSLTATECRNAIGRRSSRRAPGAPGRERLPAAIGTELVSDRPHESPREEDRPARMFRGERGPPIGHPDGASAEDVSAELGVAVVKDPPLQRRGDRRRVAHVLLGRPDLEEPRPDRAPGRFPCSPEDGGAPARAASSRARRSTSRDRAASRRSGSSRSRLRTRRRPRAPRRTGTPRRDARSRPSPEPAREPELGARSGVPRRRRDPRSIELIDPSVEVLARPDETPLAILDRIARHLLRERVGVLQRLPSSLREVRRRLPPAVAIVVVALRRGAPFEDEDASRLGIGELGDRRGPIFEEERRASRPRPSRRARVASSAAR